MNKIALAITSLVAIGLVIIVTVLALDLHSATGQIAQLRGQVIKDTSRVNSQQASLRGTHRDLITCADLESLLSDMNNASDSSGDTLFWGRDYSSVIALPAHCVNN